MSEAVTHEDLRDAFLECRRLGHAWYSASASHLSAAETGFYWDVNACARCTADRTDLVVSGVGDVVSRKYRYPEGYEIDESVTRSQLRVEWEKRRASRTRSRKRAA